MHAHFQFVTFSQIIENVSEKVYKNFKFNEFFKKNPDVFLCSYVNKILNKSIQTAIYYILKSCYSESFHSESKCKNFKIIANLKCNKLRKQFYSSHRMFS